MTLHFAAEVVVTCNKKCRSVIGRSILRFGNKSPACNRSFTVVAADAIIPIGAAENDVAVGTDVVAADAFAADAFAEAAKAAVTAVAAVASVATANSIVAV